MPIPSQTTSNSIKEWGNLVQNSRFFLARHLSALKICIEHFSFFFSKIKTLRNTLHSHPFSPGVHVSNANVLIQRKIFFFVVNDPNSRKQADFQQSQTHAACRKTASKKNNNKIGGKSHVKSTPMQASRNTHALTHTSMDSCLDDRPQK